MYALASLVPHALQLSAALLPSRIKTGVRYVWEKAMCSLRVSRVRVGGAGSSAGSSGSECSSSISTLSPWGCAACERRAGGRTAIWLEAR
eukprot:scaffold193231_cov39-Tisochrysis_lutea.AAC.4